MGSLIGELEVRRAVVRARVEELEGEIAALTVRLEAERERLERLTVTRETLDELAAEGVTVDAARGPVEAGPVGGGAVVGVQTVTVWREAMTSVDLPPVYRDIVDVVDDAPGPVQAKQIVPRIGLPAQTSKIEGTRGKLKRLVERGWLEEQTPGLFAPSARRVAGRPAR